MHRVIVHTPLDRHIRILFLPLTSVSRDKHYVRYIFSLEGGPSNHVMPLLIAEPPLYRRVSR